MNIGFDLDKVFIDYPPFVPDWIIDKLYKKKSNGTLLYRIPGKLEQQIRIISHHPSLRPLIKENLAYAKELAKSKKNKLFLVSSRFGFLKPRTEYLIYKYHLNRIFSGMYFNYHNEQPHIFKDSILASHKLDTFVDDDLALVKYLAKKHPEVTFFWLNAEKTGKISPNIYAITHISDILH